MSSTICIISSVSMDRIVIPTSVIIISYNYWKLKCVAIFFTFDGAILMTAKIIVDDWLIGNTRNYHIKLDTCRDENELMRLVL